MAWYYANSLEKGVLKGFVGHESDPKGLLSLSHLSDFSKAMGFSIYLLKDYLVNKSDEKTYTNLEEEFKKITIQLSSHYCLVAKPPIDDVQGINSLVKLGFYHVGGETFFSLDLDRIKDYQRVSSFQNIRLGEEKDLIELKILSNQSHFDIRYLYDPVFDVEAVKKYYANIVTNSFFKKNHFVFVYEEHGQIKGFLTAIINENIYQLTGRKLSSLDYISVSPSCQQKAIGFALNCYALNYLKKNGINAVCVKTMASNYRAIKLLRKNDFTLTSQNLVLHHHQNKHA